MSITVETYAAATQKHVVANGTELALGENMRLSYENPNTLVNFRDIEIFTEVEFFGYDINGVFGGRPAVFNEVPFNPNSNNQIIKYGKDASEIASMIVNFFATPEGSSPFLRPQRRGIRKSSPLRRVSR